MSEKTAYLKAIDDDKLELVIEDDETANKVFSLNMIYSRSYIQSVLSAIPNIRKTNNEEYVYVVPNFDIEVFDYNLLNEIKKKAQDEKLKYLDKNKTFYTIVYKNSFEWNYCVTEHEYDVRLIGRQSSRSFILLNGVIWGDLYNILSFINSISIEKLESLKN